MRIAIGIATTGRREQMHATLAQIALQQLQPERVYVCPAHDDDFDETAARTVCRNLTVVRAPKGSCSQRNGIIRAATDIDVMVFMDDDFYPAADYLLEVKRLFESSSDLMVASNHPEVDGAAGPGISHAVALQILAAMRPLTASESRSYRTFGAYGCNMAVRLEPVRAHGIWFDERMPLYGWLEDLDFSRRVALHGRLIEAPTLRGVHLAIKSGRTQGIRLGYSQVANPIYLVRKGTMTSAYACRQVARNVAKNIARSIWPESWVDRRGRLLGNLIGFRDWALRRLDPANIVNL
jgi:GT2 family glycosyltransferase